MKEDVLTEDMTQPFEEEDYVTERHKPMPNKIHGTLQAQIIFLLKSIYGNKYNPPGEVTLKTEPQTSTPDICIYTKSKLDIRTVTAKEEEAPITTIEIQSPSQSIDELQKKAWELYFPFGVKSAWIVIPALKAVQVLTNDDQQFFFNSGKLSDPITGIELSIEKIFEDLL